MTFDDPTTLPDAALSRATDRSGRRSRRSGPRIARPPRRAGGRRSRRRRGAGRGADNARWGAGYFPNVTLTTQDGEQVRFYDDLVKGKIVAINLIYTTCKYACPLETARLAQVQKLLGDRMGRDVFFYSITIDPEHDTPAVLKAYAEKYQAGPGLDVPHRQEGATSS